MDDLNALREAILATCRRCVELGYFLGTWGNVSARYGDAFLVTPTRMDYATMTPADLVLIDTVSGERREGERLPSSEMQVHRAIYLARPDVGAVVHSHSPYASVVSCMHRTIPCLLEDMAQLIGEVRCAPYTPAGQHLQLAAGAVAHLGGSNAVLLANHGPVCCGRTLAEAMLVNQVLEKATLAFLSISTLSGEVKAIPSEYVASERYRYLYKYGSAADVAPEAEKGAG